MSTTELNLWDRQQGEPDAAWAAFLVYRGLAHPRKQVKAYRHYTGIEDAPQAAGVFNGWVRRWHWVERVRAYDQHIEAENLSAKIAASRAWETRRWKNLEQAAEIGESFLERAKILMKYPIVEQISRDGKTIIQPCNAQYSEMAMLYFQRGLDALLRIGAVALPGESIKRKDSIESLPPWLLEIMREDGNTDYTGQRPHPKESTASDSLHSPEEQPADHPEPVTTKRSAPPN